MCKDQTNACVKLLIMDVDGTLTDGKIYIGSSGEVMKAFDIKDGYGIHNILPQYGIVPVIITGRTSAIVECRAKELGIVHLYQGVADKAKCVHDISQALNVPFEQIACMGDDLNDFPMMRFSGIRGCPSDAADRIKSICDYVCKAPGGHGAVREFIEWLVQNDETSEF